MSREWRSVRMAVLERDKAKCSCCGRTSADGIKINVDHIKNRHKHPELALTLSNLQVLCNECNHGKGNRYDTNWRASHRPRRGIWYLEGQEFADSDRIRREFENFDAILFMFDKENLGGAAIVAETLTNIKLEDCGRFFCPLDGTPPSAILASEALTHEAWDASISVAEFNAASRA